MSIATTRRLAGRGGSDKAFECVSRDHFVDRAPRTKHTVALSGLAPRLEVSAHVTGNATAGNKDAGDSKDVSSTQEPAATPAISVADLPLEAHPVETVGDEIRGGIKKNVEKIASSWRGSVEKHQLGKLGEYAFGKHFNIPNLVDMEVYPDGGNGGFDLPFRGAKFDVKTVSRRYAEQPKLRVNVYEQLRADYYALVSRIGPGDFRLIGYAPRKFVAEARKRSYEGHTYHLVDQEYLFPFLGSGKFF